VLLWAVVAVPPRLIDTSGIVDPAKGLDEVNGLRTTLAGVLGGLAVAAGAFVGALNFRETSRQNRAVLELQRRGQVTERFTKAIEQLGQRGDEKLDVRIGAVYALEQIARDSAELHWPIMEVLTAYLREHAPILTSDLLGPPAQPGTVSPPEVAVRDSDVAGKRAAIRETTQLIVDEVELMFRRGVMTDGERYRKVVELWTRAAEDLAYAILQPFDRLRTPADHQAIATVIGRRHRDHDRDGQRLDLHETHLCGVRWGGANLKAANLQGAHLEGAVLSEAHLEGANLYMAYLEGANLYKAHLEGANLRKAHLEKAALFEARLEGAVLSEAHLEGTSLRGAHLEEARLGRAHLEWADLREALGLTLEQLQAADHPEHAHLPPDLAARLAAAGEPADPVPEPGREASDEADS
jgi:uncharacterized protein YjbI with pentapeptide repeats